MTSLTFNFLHAGEFFMLSCPLLIFFSNQLSAIPSECRTVWIQIRPDILSGLIWVLAVCRGYQQNTLADKELKLMVLTGLKSLNSTQH